MKWKLWNMTLHPLRKIQKTYTGGNLDAIISAKDIAYSKFYHDHYTGPYYIIEMVASSLRPEILALIELYNIIFKKTTFL